MSTKIVVEVQKEGKTKALGVEPFIFDYPRAVVEELFQSAVDELFENKYIVILKPRSD